MIKTLKNKSIITVIIGITGIFICANIALANESIDRFTANIDINTNGQIDVTESIDYDFGNEKKRGIYRELPYKYNARGGNYTVDITDISATDETGYSYQTQISKTNGNLKIRIGNPDKYITGRQNYVIKYSVTGAINFFENHDELYWNVTGNEWIVPMQNVSSVISIPGSIERDAIQTQCFAGAFGSNNICNDSFYSTDGPNSSKAMFTQDLLKPSEALTIVIGIPKGIIKEPTWQDKILKIITDNWIVVVPVLTLIALYYLWRTRGRDPKGRGAIVAQYGPPKGLSPSQIGTIIDEKVDQVDMSADIVHLAVNGFLKIKRIEEKKLFSKKIDYELIKLKPADSTLSKPETKLFTKLFKDNKKSIKLSDLKNEFYKDWAQIKKVTYESVVEEKYFPKNPAHVRIIYATIGILLFDIIGTIVAYAFMGLIGAISMSVSGILIALFGLVMPVKTKKGVLMKEYILGMKRYISIAEKERIKFHNAPEKNPDHFDKLLPFAMVLKVEKQWAKQFKDLYKEQPSWYEGSPGTRFNSVILASHMSNFSTTTSSTLASKPSSAASGGSGFSGGGVGGGFGGGGGGSW
jgi:uncharacterized membrane protein